MTAPDEALATARRYVAKERSYCHVTGLLEDDSDYFIQTELNDPRAGWPCGPGALLIAKATGEVWTYPFHEMFEKFDGMRPV